MSGGRPEQYGRGVRARPPLLDVVLCVVLTGLGLVEAAWGMTGEPAPWYVVASVPFVTLPVVIRRVRPLLAVALVSAAVLVQALLGSSMPGGFTEAVALVVVVYAAGSVLELRSSVVAVVTAAVAQCTVIVVEGDARAGNFVYATTVVVVAWLAGRGVRLADERSRLLAERRAMQERARIARELHDVVSHHVSGIVVQAAAERRDHPEGSSAAEVLGTIEQEGRQTLQELRGLLGLLRVDDEGPPLTPQPGAADLPGLVDSARSTGVEVSLESVGDPAPVGEGVGLAVYRLVQECLTNARKHTTDPRAAVTVSWGPQEVAVDVLSSGTPTAGRPVPGSGYGLTAMAERVRAHGGTITATPTERGFRVHATLPVGTP